MVFLVSFSNALISVSIFLMFVFAAAMMASRLAVRARSNCLMTGLFTLLFCTCSLRSIRDLLYSVIWLFMVLLPRVAPRGNISFAELACSLSNSSLVLCRSLFSFCSVFMLARFLLMCIEAVAAMSGRRLRLLYDEMSLSTSSSSSLM